MGNVCFSRPFHYCFGSASPSKTGQAPGCHRGIEVSRIGRVEYRERTVAQADVGTSQIVSGRPCGCPKSFLRLWRVTAGVWEGRSRTEPRVKLAPLSPGPLPRRGWFRHEAATYSSWSSRSLATLGWPTMPIREVTRRGVTRARSADIRSSILGAAARPDF